MSEETADTLELDWTYCADYPRDAAMDIYRLRTKLERCRYGLTIAKRDIGNWVEHPDAKESAIDFLDKILEETK